MRSKNRRVFKMSDRAQERKVTQPLQAHSNPDDMRGEVERQRPARWCSNNAQRDDSLGYSIRRLGSYGKGKMQAIGRGLKLDVEDLEEEELRRLLGDYWKAWTPNTIVHKIKQDNKPANVLNMHSVEELLATLRILELEDMLVLCFYTKNNCYACHSVQPKIHKLAAATPDITVLRINYDDFPEFCRSVVNVKHMPLIQVYRGSSGLLDQFTIPLTNFSRLRASLSEHNSPRSSLSCPMCCPFPPPPTWKAILGLPPMYIEDSWEVGDHL
eukprot:CAMPEP_0114226634 /NCGR_PEP_ID=MMETSP0058-20121206/1341_1 /TAXON_ID=36894 /ORGANISM="Pyramimonas parkeae, CCMP726" /LENGTH=269 /DNA_ID=CAMNT_0001337381 /DNA_START=162 /DNA_END=971 /DNA_ORIENTATION=+